MLMNALHILLPGSSLIYIFTYIARKKRCQNTFYIAKNGLKQGFSGLGYYSHSIVPMGLGVRSRRTRLMPSTSEVIRAVIL